MFLSDELAFLDATAQADLVCRKQLKPIELVDAAIARIKRRCMWSTRPTILFTC